MVWGMIEPIGLGDYFVDGELDEWRATLKAHFNEKMTDAERARYEGRDTEYVYQTSRKFCEDLGPLEPHEIPNQYNIYKKSNNLGSIVLGLSGIHAVDVPLKNLIEALEPGVHQFWPMPIMMRGNKKYPAPYYGLVIRQSFDSFRPDQSAEGSWIKSASGYWADGDSKKVVKGLALEAETFGAAHLWREKSLNRPQIYISDTLQQAIAEAELRIWRHFKMKEV